MLQYGVMLPLSCNVKLRCRPLVWCFGAAVRVGFASTSSWQNALSIPAIECPLLCTQAWADSALNATAPGLAAKLGPVVPAHTILGPISQYMVARYGFTPNCQVVAWSGDNPNSVAGLGLRAPGDLGLSMGTSDTLMSITDAADSRPGLEGHFFVNPVSPTSHMSLLCYKNGSLARAVSNSHPVCPGQPAFHCQLRLIFVAWSAILAAGLRRQRSLCDTHPL